MPRTKNQQPPPPSVSRFTRRDALKAGLGLGALATAGGIACGPMSNRCAGGPQLPANGVANAQLAAIDTIVVLMLENRSFDNFLGALKLDSSYRSAAAVDGLSGGEEIPNASGTMVPLMRMAGNGAVDPKHDWVSSRTAFNRGRNDGFLLPNPGVHQNEVMSYYGSDHIPFLHALAREFTVCDRWFSSVMGPTWPNRFYLHAATADGHKTNLPMGLSPPPTIWERMADRCWTAKNYYSSKLPWYSLAFPAKSFSGDDAVTPETLDHFFADAAAAIAAQPRDHRPRLRGERRPPAPRPRAVRGVRRQRLPGDGGEPAVVALAAGRDLRRARRLLRSRGPARDRRSESRVSPAGLSRAGDRRRAARCGGARWCRRRSSTCRSRRRWGRASGSPAWGGEWTPANDLSSCLDPERGRRAGAVAADGRAQRIAHVAVPLRATSQPEMHALADSERCAPTGTSICAPARSACALPELQPGESVRFSGVWATHSDYGSQFRAETVEQMAPATVEGLRRYLGSGLIKGVGPVTARKIVDHFGMQTLEILEQAPERMMEVPGVGKHRVSLIRQAWIQQKQIKEVMLFLQSHRVTTALAVRIYKAYGDTSIQQVQANPYQLAQDIYGIGFKTADQIALNLGLSFTSPDRVAAGVIYALNQLSEDGHVFGPREEVARTAADLLDVPFELCDAAVAGLQERGQLMAERIPVPSEQRSGSALPAPAVPQ